MNKKERWGKIGREKEEEGGREKKKEKKAMVYIHPIKFRRCYQKWKPLAQSFSKLRPLRPRCWRSAVTKIRPFLPELML